MGNRKQNIIKAILLDLDGVLYVGDKAIRGAAETVSKLRHLGLQVVGVTNTTTQPRRLIAEKLESMGIPFRPEDIHTPAALARQQIGKRTARLYIRESLQEDFPGIRTADRNAEFIVMATWAARATLRNC